jgi:hypothetical protein
MSHPHRTTGPIRLRAGRLGAALCILAGASFADPLDTLVPVGEGALGATHIGIGQSVISLSGVEQNANVDNTQIVVTDNGQANTGQIADNIVQNNSGLTTFLANTGNNVSVNNSTILNIFLNPPAGP